MIPFWGKLEIFDFLFFRKLDESINKSPHKLSVMVLLRNIMQFHDNFSGIYHGQIPAFIVSLVTYLTCFYDSIEFLIVSQISIFLEIHKDLPEF